MAVIEVKGPVGMRYQNALTGGPKEELKYLIITDSIMRPYLIAASVPHTIGEAHPDEYLNMQVTDISVDKFEENNTYYMYTATVLYENPTEETTTGGGGGGGSGTIFARTIDIRNQIVTLKTNKDRDGNKIVTKAGVPFNYDIESYVYARQYTLKFSTTQVHKAGIDATLGKVNDAVITINIKGWTEECAINTLLFQDINITVPYLTQTDDYIPIFDYELTFLYRSDGWKLKIPSKGYHFKDAAGKLQSSDNEVFHKADGTLAAPGDDIVFVEADIYGEADFLTNIGELVNET